MIIATPRGELVVFKMSWQCIIEERKDAKKKIVPGKFKKKFSDKEVLSGVRFVKNS